MIQPREQSIPRKAARRYPLGLCLASIALTWTGLAAAAMGIKWGVAPPAGDALPLAWSYVNEMALLMTAIVWPAMALRKRATGHARGELGWQMAAIFAGAFPCLMVAGALADESRAACAGTLALQVGVALLALGVISVEDRLCGMGATLLAAWIVAGPVAAFIWEDFFPRAWNRWIAALPAVAIVRAPGGSNEGRWILAGACALLGIGLSLIPKNPRATPAPA